MPQTASQRPHVVPETPVPRRLPLAVYLITAGAFLMGTSEFVVAGVLPELAASFDVSVARAGLAITVFAVGMVIGPPTMALATLRLPRRSSLIVALLVFAGGHVLAALTPDFGVLLLARFVTALATGAYWGVAAAFTSSLVAPSIRSRALGVVMGSAMLATVVGVPLGSLAGQLWGWRLPFYALAVLAITTMIALALWAPHGRAPEGVVVSVRADLAGLASGRLWWTLTACGLITAGVLSIYSFIAPLLVQHSHLPERLVPVALAMFGGAALIGTVLGGRFGDTRPLTVAFVTASLTLVTVLGLFFASSNLTMALLLVSLLGLTGLSANPVLASLAVHFGKGSAVAAAMPTSIFNLGTTVGTAVTSAMVASGVGVTAPLAIGIVSGVLLFVPLTALARTRRRWNHGVEESVVSH